MCRFVSFEPQNNLHRTCACRCGIIPLSWGQACEWVVSSQGVAPLAAKVTLWAKGERLDGIHTRHVAHDRRGNCGALFHCGTKIYNISVLTTSINIAWAWGDWMNKHADIIYNQGKQKLPKSQCCLSSKGINECEVEWQQVWPHTGQDVTTHYVSGNNSQSINSLKAL